MARASEASKGHNWRLKVFTRALTKMEGNSIPRYEPVHFDIIIIYMNFHRLNCPCSPSTSDCRENTTPIPNKYNFIFVTNTNLHSNKYYIINEQWVQLLKGHGRMRTWKDEDTEGWGHGRMRTWKDEDCWVFLPVVRVWVGCCGHTRGNSCYPPQDRPFSWVVDVSG